MATNNDGNQRPRPQPPATGGDRTGGGSKNKDGSPNSPNMSNVSISNAEERKDGPLNLVPDMSNRKVQAGASFSKGPPKK